MYFQDFYKFTVKLDRHRSVFLVRISSDMSITKVQKGYYHLTCCSSKFLSALSPSPHPHRPFCIPYTPAVGHFVFPPEGQFAIEARATLGAPS